MGWRQKSEPESDGQLSRRAKRAIRKRDKRAKKAVRATAKRKRVEAEAASLRAGQSKKTIRKQIKSTKKADKNSLDARRAEFTRKFDESLVRSKAEKRPLTKRDVFLELLEFFIGW